MPSSAISQRPVLVFLSSLKIAVNRWENGSPSRQSFPLFRRSGAYGSDHLPSPAETGEDAPVEVLETRTRRRRKAPRHRPAPEAITMVLVEFPRS
jgi:hypothetical protein